MQPRSAACLWTFAFDMCKLAVAAIWPRLAAGDWRASASTCKLAAAVGPQSTIIIVPAAIGCHAPLAADATVGLASRVRAPLRGPQRELGPSWRRPGRRFAWPPGSGLFLVRLLTFLAEAARLPALAPVAVTKRAFWRHVRPFERPQRVLGPRATSCRRLGRLLGLRERETSDQDEPTSFRSRITRLRGHALVSLPISQFVSALWAVRGMRDSERFRQ